MLQTIEPSRNYQVKINLDEFADGVSYEEEDTE